MKKRVILGVAVLSICGLLGCGHDHIWVGGDCVTAKNCSICGELEGEPLGHEFMEADCTRGEMCKACGTVQGEPTAHSCDLGVCTMCGETVNKELAEAIIEKLDRANNILNLTLGSAEQAYQTELDKFRAAETPEDIIALLGDSDVDSYMIWMDEAICQRYYADVIEYYNEVAKLYEEAKNLCGDNKGLAGLKTTLTDLTEVLPPEEPKAKENKWSEFDKGFADFEQEEMSAALATWGEYWTPFFDTLNSYDVKAASAWTELKNAARAVGITVYGNWWE